MKDNPYQFIKSHHLIKCRSCGKKNRVPDQIPLKRANCGHCHEPLIISRSNNIYASSSATNDNILKRYLKIWLPLVIIGFAIYLFLNFSQEKFDQPALALPTSGLKSTAYSKADAIAPFEIVTRPNSGNHFYIRLYYWDTDRIAATIFVRSGEKVEIDVPLGSYELKYATGSIWYGPEYRFGPKTIYYKADDIFRFRRSGDTIMGWTVELFKRRLSESQYKK